jgi:prepilin-type N-terminal cleavage/methylation domain-containing protein
MKSENRARNRERGFSLIELMVALLMLGIISAGIFQQMDVAQQRAYTEQVKLDNFQEGRDFVDQFFRDINQIGYPNSRMVDTTSAGWVPPFANPLINDSRLAIGLVKVDANEIRFEADSNGDGNPESIIYMINGSGTCLLCLQRSQVDKVSADPLNGQAVNWGTEVNDVVSNAIFSYFDVNGNAVAVPVDISTPGGAQIIASIKTIQISLTIRNPSVKDLQTGQAIETTFQGEISVNNCSMAATVASGAPMACK